MRSLVLFVILATACAKGTTTAPAPKRATLMPRSASSFEIIPAPGQLPFCLAYTVSQSGVIRLLTMSPENTSFECPAGEPVGHHPYRVPQTEPSVRVLVLFTSQAVNPTSVSQQLLETKNAAALTAMGLRLPGQAALELLDFSVDGGTAP